MIILSCDPSLTAWGYSIYDTSANRVIGYGVIQTSPEDKKRKIRKGDDRIRRITVIANRLLEIIKQYQVNYIVSELPHGSQSAVVAVMIGLVTGVLQTLGITKGIPVEWYYESDCKAMVHGRKDVTKEENKIKMFDHYHLILTKVKYVDEAVADSLAVLYTAQKQSEIIQTHIIHGY